MKRFVMVIVMALAAFGVAFADGIVKVSVRGAQEGVMFAYDNIVSYDEYVNEIEKLNLSPSYTMKVDECLPDIISYLNDFGCLFMAQDSNIWFLIKDHKHKGYVNMYSESDLK